MKKVLGILFIMIFMFAMTGCGSEKEPVKVKLTSENFSEYFSISAQASDFTVDEKSSILGTDYIGYANLKIVVNPKKEFKTEDVSIGGKVTISGMCWSGEIDPYFEVVLDMNGKAEYMETITFPLSFISSPKFTLRKKSTPAITPLVFSPSIPIVLPD